MNIAIITPALSGHLQRGVGVYTQQLLTRLKKSPKHTIIETTYTAIPQNADVVHFTYFDPFFLTLPVFAPKNMLVTIHDLIPIRFPQHFPRGIQGEIKWQIQKFRVKQSKAVIADSAASARDVAHFLGVTNEKIHVVPLGVDEKFFVLQTQQQKSQLKAKYKLPENFALFVGDIGWNKNLISVLKAARIAEIPLVIVSRTLGTSGQIATHPSHQSWLQALHAELKQTKYLLLDTVETDELSALYQLATVFIFPSFYEGFGLPVLEAFASSCPVVTTHGGSLKEVAGEYAYIVNPKNPVEIAEGIKQIRKNPAEREKNSEKAKNWARKFTWEKTTEQTLALYEKIYTE